MIEINLLPGAKKAKRRAGGAPSINYAAIGAWISSKVQDKWLAAAVGTAAVSLAVIGFLFMSQRGRASTLDSELEVAVADSTKYAAVIKDRNRALARRDSVLLQLSIIRAIDEDRYIWPHLLEEVSRALPIYTWLTSLALNSAPQGTNPAAAVKMPPPDTGAVPSKRTLPPIPRDSVRVRMIGRSVDIQAITRFMRSLEESPFLGAVQLVRTEVQLEGGKDIYQFTFDLRYTHPDTLLLNRVPLKLSSR
jgi:Tfp pilus assembly protein PilN